MVSSLRDALRGLRSHTGFSFVAFAIFALAIAAGTVTYSVVDAIVLRPLPFAAPERLVAIPSLSRTGAVPGASTPQDYFAWRERLTSVESLGAVGYAPPLRRTSNGQTEVFSARAVTWNLFESLGVRPRLGRFFNTADETGSTGAPLILSYELWMHRFSGDPAVIGQRLDFGGASREIVGVLPPGVAYPVPVSAPPADVYVPYVPEAKELDYQSLAQGWGMSMGVVGRLRPGVSIDQARAEVARVAAGLASTLPGVHLPQPVVMPLLDFVVGSAKSWLLMILGAVALVVLAACVNVANLLLTRGAVRARELATREALGATRARLCWNLILEGLLLASSASAAGVGLSVWGVRLAKASLPAGLARATTIAIDGRVLAMAVAATVVCGLASSSIPAWLTSRTDLVTFLKAGGSVTGASGKRRRPLLVLLVAEIAFVTTILVATLLVVTSYVLVSTADLGFDRRSVFAVAFEQDLRGVAKADQPAAIAVFQADLLARVRAVRGVGSAALTSNGPPLVGGSARYSITIPGYGVTRDQDMLEMHPVSPGYLETTGTKILRGRDFSAADKTGAPAVAMIDDSAAQRFFGGRDPIGQIVSFRGPTTIVGVLRNVRFHGPEREPLPQLYVPIAQEYVWFGDLVIRAAGPPAAVAAAVEDAIRPVMGSRRIEPRYLEDSFHDLTASRRFNAGLLSVFGVFATLIGVAGVYGVMAFVVTQQVRSIGLRIALGATRQRVVNMVLLEAMRPTVVGVASGLAGAYAISSLARSLVFGVTPTSPLIYAAVGAVVTLAALTAAIVPAARAAAIDPLTALRAE
jgi:predicted permease